jgi:glycosyltransferase involved in cell wall biosynthesis
MEIPAARLLIVGDGPCREAITATVDQLGLADHVRLLGTRDDVPELLAAADVLVLTSDMEASPVSILEAMACGKPVVATQVGSVAASVHDGQTGFLAEPGDWRRIARHVIHLLRKPALAHQMGERGRQHVLAHASLERMVRGYEQLVSDIYRRKSSPASATRGDGLSRSTTGRGSLSR